MEKCSDLLLCRRFIAGHPEVPAQFLNGRHSRRNRHFLCDSGECVVQTPGVPGAKLVHEWLEIEIRRLRKKANRQDSLDKDIVKNRLRLTVRQRQFLQVVNLARELSEVILEPEDRIVDLSPQVESRGVFAVERNQVSAEDHI